MSNAEIPSEPAAATRQEEVPESAEAIADRILGNSGNNFEMSSLSRETDLSRPTDAGSGSPPSVLPLAVNSSGNVPTEAPAVTDAEAGTAAAPIAGTSTASEALHGDAAPVSPSDILTRAVVLTIINTTTDSRHKVVLDDNYLAKRSVSPPEGLITNLSVYTLKELIWRDWRHGDWEERPRDPSFIRLIHMGRMLEDNTFLRDNRFQVGETPHVVHMTLKPDLPEEDNDGKAGKTASRIRSRRSQTADGTDEERTPGCRCLLM